MLTSLTLQRFRSFRGARLDLANPTFLVGRNGSGKSNLADAFAFLTEAMTSPLGAILDRRGGMSAVANRRSARGRPANLGLRIALETDEMKATYAFEISAARDHGVAVTGEQCHVQPVEGPASWFERRDGDINSNASGLRPAAQPDALALPLVGGDARFGKVRDYLAAIRICRIEPSRLRELQDPDGGTRLRPAGQNSASVLRAIQRESAMDWEMLRELLQSIAPGAITVQPKRLGDKLTIEFAQDWGQAHPVRFPATGMSDGTLRAVGLLAAVFQRPRPSMLVVEEPEATIHPGALGAVLDLLRLASQRMQVVVTTHSPELLDAKWIRDCHLRIVSWRDGHSQVAPVSESVRETFADHLMGAGEMLRMNALTPEPVLDDGFLGQRLFEELQKL